MTTENNSDDKMASGEASSFNFEGSIVTGSAITANSIIKNIASDKSSLRKWWHDIIGNYGKFSCYAMFLVLPSDKEAMKYLTEFGKELHIISGDDCLIIALSKNEFKITNFDEGTWNIVIEEHSTEGYSVKIAHMFNVDITEFPCLLLFRDIRSSEHVIVSLKEIKADEITTKMRVIFSEIHKSVNAKKNPLVELTNLQSREKIKTVARKISGKVETMTEKTFEAAMNAFVEATIKP